MKVSMSRIPAISVINNTLTRRVLVDIFRLYMKVSSILAISVTTGSFSKVVLSQGAVNKVFLGLFH